MTSVHWFYFFAFFGLLAAPGLFVFAIMWRLGPEVRRESDNPTTYRLVTRP